MELWSNLRLEQAPRLPTEPSIRERSTISDVRRYGGARSCGATAPDRHCAPDLGTDERTTRASKSCRHLTPSVFGGRPQSVPAPPSVQDWKPVRDWKPVD